jgi:hypothetical protein
MSGTSNVQHVHCNNCGGERKHALVHIEKTSREYETSDPMIIVSEMNWYATLKCGGCEAVQIRHTKRFSEDDGNTVRFLPAHMPRQLPDWIDRHNVLTGKDGYIRVMLREIYAALAADASSVGAMGVRALLEFIMVSKVRDQGSFAANLDEFEKQGYVAKLERDRLKRVLDVGSAAIHRGFLVSPLDAMTLLRIAEHVVESLYIHDGDVAHVSSKVPPRARRAKSAQKRKIRP